MTKQIAMIALASAALATPASYAPPNEKDLPNPFRTATGWAQFNRHFGAGMFVQQHGMHVDKQGNVWIRVAVDHQGNVYGAEVGPKDLKRYVKR